MQVACWILFALQTAIPAQRLVEPKLPLTSEVDGIYLDAFVAAFKDFKSLTDLPRKKKDLTGYVVFFKSESDRIVVSFLPKWPAGSLPSGETPYGREVTYTLDAKTLKVLDRSFGE